MNGIDIRMSRLFSGGENAVVVAVDHGEFDGPIPGMVDLPETVKSIDPGVSAVLVSPGMIRHCAPVFCGKGAPVAMVRVNWSTVYAFHWNYNDANTVQAVSIADAVASGADTVLISLTLKTGSEERDAANAELFCRLAGEAHHLGIPVVGEIFPAHSGALSPEEMHDQVLRGCRIVAELGADLVKTFYTHKFKNVTDGCPVPVLGLGAEKTPRQIQALELAERIVQDGGRGVVFGRNAIQVANPQAFQQALCDVVRRGVPAASAVKQYGLED
jgi:DhnA family fructose-bisphosphate aldolase class Ia